MISIVVTAWNRPDNILNSVLHSISQQTFKDFEVILVDDGSTKGNCKQITLSYSDRINIKYIYNNNPKHTSNSLAFNIGIKNSSFDIVVLSGGDILWTKNILEKIFQAFQNNSFPKLVVGPTVYGLSKKGTDKILSLFPEWEQEISKLDLTPSGWNGLGNTDCSDIYSGPTRRDEVSAGGFPVNFLSAYRKQFLYDLGGFDEEYVAISFEDTDFTWRVKLSGGLPCWIDALAFHLFHTNEICYSEVNKPRFKSLQARIKQLGTCRVNLNKEWGVILK